MTGKYATLEDHVLAIIAKTPGNTMEQIIANASNGYRREWRDTVDELRQAGKLTCTWDEIGYTHYTIAK